MAKLNLEGLEEIRERMRPTVALRKGNIKTKVTVHMGTCGIEAGSRDVMSALMDAYDATERIDIGVFAGPCLEMCEREPLVTVAIEGQDPVLYGQMTPERMTEVFQKHVLDGNPQAEYAVQQAE